MKIPYIVKLAVSGKKFSSRPVFGPNWTQPELDTIISAATGVPPAKCAEIGRLYFLTLLHALLPRRIFDLFGLLRVEPTTGGTAATVDGFHNATDLQASFSITFRPEVLKQWRQEVTLEKVGEEGQAIPLIRSVRNVLTGHPNTYTDGQNVLFEGGRLGFTPTNPTQGVFLALSDAGPWIRVNIYGPITDRRIYALIPAGTTGPIRLKVVNKAGHETVYTATLTPEPPPA